MILNRLMLAAPLICGFVSVAHARSNPEPPPSGIVVHLFGPDSIMSQIAPDLPGETRKPQPAQHSGGAQSGGAQSGSAQAGGAQQNAANGSIAAQTSASGSTASASQSDYSEPSMHDVLHQMFVTGDPNDPNKPSIGRAADRPSTGK